MQFEINLPGGIDGWALQYAGLDVDDWGELSFDVRFNDAPLPQTPKCAYLHDPSLAVSVTVLSIGGNDNIDRWSDKSGRIAFKRVTKAETPTTVRVEIDDTKAGKAIQKKLEFYSYENDGELIWWKEHSEIYAQIDKILSREGLSTEKLECAEGPMSRQSVEALIEFAGSLEPSQRDNIHNIFTHHNVAKKDWPIAVAWLIKEFERNWKLDDQLSTRIYELTVRAIAEDLIRFIKDKRYGDRRWPLCLALAKTKHPKAADVIASILGQGVNTRGALEALAKLPAHAYIDKIKKYLRDSNSDVRRQAKKTLQKLGVAFETSPPPVHLIKKSPPKKLPEWSANLDIDQVEPTLQKLSRCVEKGFGPQELKEVAGVVEAMYVEQTKAFCFPVTTGKEKSDLWISIFMDDTDAPDLEIRASAQIIQKLPRLSKDDA